MIAIAPLVEEKQKLQNILNLFGQIYSRHFLLLMGDKLGIDRLSNDDFPLVKEMLAMLQALSVDYTLFFRTLSRYDGERTKLLALGVFHKPMNEWLDKYDIRLKQNKKSMEKRHEKMLKINPKYVLKNYMLQEAIDAASSGDFSVIDTLFNIAQNPYDEHEAFERWAGVTPLEFRNQKLSCSS